MRLRLTEVKYMGYVLTSQGVKPDPAKLDAVTQMSEPTDKKGVQRLIGCVTYLSKFMPNLSETAELPRRFTDKEAHVDWLPHHAEAFMKIKQAISTAPVLKYFDLNEDAVIQCDASESGLGATLLQQGRPDTFASRVLTKTERN
ncbi:hypothetical protein BSL78_11730 [Apostichopus japonicus]|uniref:Reverse transcriptase/retrotransposon-derived protein RNase H-like domain-containing protein n=1 Tax=Stichopus japonicus TaxID=307972 RepID=A0A2G8KTQ8_STIJA|nr:hypothetical protein BSL78_11730 [Apostichopus japonicus]